MINNPNEVIFRPEPRPKKVKKFKNKTVIEKLEARVKVYNITKEQYSEMYEKQNGKCAICGKWKGSEGMKGLVIDHDHQTNVFRQLLCQNCNHVLGLIEEGPGIDAYVDYINKHKLLFKVTVINKPLDVSKYEASEKSIEEKPTLGNLDKLLVVFSKV
jgi:hypothetical protein